MLVDGVASAVHVPPPGGDDSTDAEVETGVGLVFVAAVLIVVVASAWFWWMKRRTARRREAPPSITHRDGTRVGDRGGAGPP